MTDIEGHKHRITIPIGKIRPEVWSAQKKYAREILPAPIAELVEKTKTKQPFVQCITDVFAAKAIHYEVWYPCGTGSSLLTYLHIAGQASACWGCVM